MTKLITILIIALAVYVAYALFSYWEQVSAEKETARKRAATAQIVPEQLPGMPQPLESSFKAAESAGPAAVGQWLKQYGKFVEDPRLAWIELDYVVALSRDNPQEARRIFHEVKGRTPASSPVYPRIKQLEKTYR